jgi:hypothetical protein
MMKTKTLIYFLALPIVAMVAGCTYQNTAEQMEKNYPGLIPEDSVFTPVSIDLVKAGVSSYAPVELKADISQLSEKEKKILSIMFNVADIMDDIYWDQTLGHKNVFLDRIQDESTKKFAHINYGPWDRLNDNQSFITQFGPKPAGANFYPMDMTREEFDALNDTNKTSQYTLLRRNPDKSLNVIWYHDAYASQIVKAAAMLKAAAFLAEDKGLKKYLKLRADALLTDDYRPSDFAWMEMKTSPIDFVVGPIENYEDGLFGYKAAQEAFILIKDKQWSERLAKFAGLLPELQKGLPVEEQYKNESPGTSSDLNAYNVIYYAGEANVGGKTIAINLPNDEEVQLKAGSRRLQLENAIKAKFDNILVPIADALIDTSQQKHIQFDAFFQNIMFHEVAHGLGVKNTINGQGSVRSALKEQYSPIEEAKADIMGLYLVTKLHEMGELEQGEVMDNYITFVAGIFRSCRFGAGDAHGKSNMIQFNYFTDNGVFNRHEDGTYWVDFEKMKEAVVSLMQKIIHVEGDGNYSEAKQWVEEKGVIPPQLQADLNRINSLNIPVDIVFIQGKKVMGLE